MTPTRSARAHPPVSVNAWLEERLARHAPTHTVLDLGCGRGWWLEQMAARALTAVGVEPDPQRAAVARRRGLRVAVADGHRLPLATGSVGLVWCIHVLHHLADPAAVLDEARRVLAPAGHLVLAETVEDHPAVRLGRRVHPAWDGVGISSRFTAAHCLDLVRSTGFEVVEHRQHSIASFAAWALPVVSRRAWLALSTWEDGVAGRCPLAARLNRYGAHLECLARAPGAPPHS